LVYANPRFSLLLCADPVPSMHFDAPSEFIEVTPPVTVTIH